MKRTKLLSTLLLSTVFSGCCLKESGLQQIDTELSLDEHSLTKVEEELLQIRHKQLLKSFGVLDEYSPTDIVQGSSDYAAYKLVDDPESIIAKGAIEEASKITKAANSTAFMVWKDGKLIHQEFADGIDVESLSVSKSLSKPITSIAVGRAIALKDIESLDQSVSDFITEWKGTDKEAILVRHLLDMRTGLLPQAFVSELDSPWMQAYLSPRHEDYIVNSYPLTNTPGEEFLYSNAASDLVAILIERATGRRYSEFVSEEVLKPVGAQGGDVWINRNGGVAHSGCCMRLPADSWLRLGVLLVQDGVYDGQKLLPEGFVAQMREGTEGNPNYGLGVWVGEPYLERRSFLGPNATGPKVLHSEPYLDPDMFLFDGSSNQVVYISPKHNLVILRMGPTPPKDNEWDNALLPNTLIRGLK